MSARQRTSAPVLAKRKAHHQELEHRAARRAPAFRDVFVLPEGRFFLAGWIVAERRGFLLRPVGELDASERDTFLSFAAWREMLFDPGAAEWREHTIPRGAA